MSPYRIIGFVALALGGVLLIFAWRASNAPIEQLSEALTGRYTNNTMWYLLAGIAGVVVGAVNRPGFPRGFFVQNLRGFFKGVHLCVERLLHFLRRPMTDGAV